MSLGCRWWWSLTLRTTGRQTASLFKILFANDIQDALKKVRLSYDYARHDPYYQCHELLAQWSGGHHMNSTSQSCIHFVPAANRKEILYTHMQRYESNMQVPLLCVNYCTIKVAVQVSLAAIWKLWCRASYKQKYSVPWLVSHCSKAYSLIMCCVSLHAGLWLHKIYSVATAKRYGQIQVCRFEAAV